MTRRRALALAAVWTLPSLVFLAIVSQVYGTWRIHVPPRLGADARAAVVATLRSGLEGKGIIDPQHRELARRLPHEGPVAATVMLEGRMIARLDGYGPTIAHATKTAAELMGHHPAIVRLDPAQRAAAEIKVDVVVGRGPIERDHPVLQLVALHPGVEGLGVTLADDKAVRSLLMPDEMFLMGLLAKKPLTSLMPEVGMGVEFAKADQILATRVAIKWSDWGKRPRRYFRFRTDAFVEAADRAQPPLALYRGLPDGPPVTPQTLRTAALEGARYLVEHLGPNGRYIYEQNLTSGQATDPLRAGPYSLPRHFGTTYFLSEIYRITKEEWLREPIERAFAHMNELVLAGGCARTLPDGTELECVIDKGAEWTNLGSTALGVVALAEYHRATGDTRYLAIATKLSNWMLWMQRPDGSFRHRYNVKKQIVDDKAMDLYFSGEAALALARMYEVTKDERYAKASEKAIDWLVGWYDFFIGGMLYGEEHWTCISAESLGRTYTKKAAWLDFCNGLARFWGESQPHPGERPDQWDLVGSHIMTPFVMPQNTPAGSHTEARISTYLLGEYHRQPSRALRREILETLHYLLRQQIRPDNDFAVVTSAKGLGAVPANPVDRTVRIDYVQHVCSAMIRAIPLAEEEARVSGK
ncbi:MAG TPA: beta-L-arabinofuranosidase domain-containing protein [Kofleriaceae bacterium]|nr:beta-L-arabinofuranosidase domain-containing protein [Kofleriaceae bacterium]